MRILFISAFYPPYCVGGWEQLVRDINEQLQERGHSTYVLTSTFEVDAPTHEPGVGRLLTLESDVYHYRPQQFLGHKYHLSKNLAHTRDTIRTFNPDVIFIHVMWNLSKGVAHVAEQLCPGRVIYYVANDWPHASDPHTAYWQSPANNPILNLAKQWIAPIPLKLVEREQKTFALQFQHVLCVSHAVKKDLSINAKIPAQNLQVVYNGVETDLFVPRASEESSLHRLDAEQHDAEREAQNRILNLLCAGSLVPHKGVHTAIEAMAILAEDACADRVHLTIAGSGHPRYETKLKQLVDSAQLAKRVRFVGRVPRSEMPALLQQHDVLVFPSIWEEPLARMTQEAMAAGLVVVGTVTGGTGELLVEGETGLTFEPGNARMLAQRIEELLHAPQLRRKLAEAGRQTVLQKFDFRRMVNEIEAHLRAVAQS